MYVCAREKGGEIEVRGGREWQLGNQGKGVGLTSSNRFGCCCCLGSLVEEAKVSRVDDKVCFCSLSQQVDLLVLACSWKGVLKSAKNEQRKIVSTLCVRHKQNASSVDDSKLRSNLGARWRLRFCFHRRRLYGRFRLLIISNRYILGVCSHCSRRRVQLDECHWLVRNVHNSCLEQFPRTQ